MTTQEVANRLVELCRAGQFEAAHDELYAADVVSIEPANSQMPGTVTGVEAIKQKGQMFQAGTEQVYGISVSEPVIAGNYFYINLTFDILMKGENMQRFDMAELCVYQVKDGKIVSEQFFY